ncbi:MAG: hypothetical protein ACYTF0_08825, partial [Planctomycetota bacterium]
FYTKTGSYSDRDSQRTYSAPVRCMEDLQFLMQRIHKTKRVVADPVLLRRRSLSGAHCPACSKPALCQHADARLKRDPRRMVTPRWTWARCEACAATFKSEDAALLELQPVGRKEWRECALPIEDTEPPAVPPPPSGGYMVMPDGRRL